MKSRLVQDAKRSAKTLNLSLIYKATFGAAATLACCASFVGCAAMNENPNNDRFWFPTLRAPSAEERAARAKTFPEGGDPYCDAEVGPRSISPRPVGWDVQRSKTSSTFGVVPDVEDDE